MGIATVTAARILRGQRLGHSGEEVELAWDKFPAVALAKVNTKNDNLLGKSSKKRFKKKKKDSQGLFQYKKPERPLFFSMTK